MFVLRKDEDAEVIGTVPQTVRGATTTAMSAGAFF